jgi:NAD(P)-dependent dehydrogenase (short-subunit alcohol dehydrogenase family)
MARVVIIGASKGIGLETTRQALEAGHMVRAFARSAGRGSARCHRPRARDLVDVTRDRCGLLKANGEDVAQILIREGLAHPYVCGSLGCPKRKP